MAMFNSYVSLPDGIQKGFDALFMACSSVDWTHGILWIDHGNKAQAAMATVRSSEAVGCFGLLTLVV